MQICGKALYKSDRYILFNHFALINTFYDAKSLNLK